MKTWYIITNNGRLYVFFVIVSKLQISTTPAPLTNLFKFFGHFKTRIMLIKVFKGDHI